MIAIQADLLEVGSEKILNFTKILDVYVVQEEEEESKQVTEKTWSDKAEWTLETAKKHLEILSELEKNIALNFTQSYVSIVINGKNYYFYDKRTKPNSVVMFNVKEEEKVDAIKKLLEENNIVYGFNKYKEFNFTFDKNFLAKNQDLLKKIHEIKLKEFVIED